MYIDPTDGCPGCGTVDRVHDVGCAYVGRDECPWCLDEHDDQHSDKLCRSHMAEHEGVSEDQLDRMEAEQGAEYADAIGDDQMYRYTYPTGGVWVD